MSPRCCVNTTAGAERARPRPAHFRGGSYRLYENKRDKHPVLTFVLDWDSPEAAQTFLSMYRQVLKGKWKKLESPQQSATGAFGNRRQRKISGTFDG